MSLTPAEIEAQARKLPAEDRARLAQTLLDSLRDASPSEIEAAWEREIEERVAAYERGETETYPADEVFAEARRLAQ